MTPTTQNLAEAAMTNETLAILFSVVCSFCVLIGAPGAAAFAGLCAIRYMVNMICTAIREAAKR